MLTPEKQRISAKKSREKIRAAILAFYGDKCNRCGHTDKRVLQVDHINRAQVPRNHTRRSGDGLWYAILNGHFDKEDFQLLCANCNWLKKLENKEHYSVTRPQA